MHELRRQHRPRPSRRTGGISIGGILGIIALIAVIVIGYMLIRGNTGNEVQEQAQQETTELQQGFDAAEARARLNGLRSSIESDIDQEALTQQYESIRADLQEAYEGASGEAATTWSELETSLGELGDQIGQESEEALATIDRMLTQFQDE